jgi:ribonuclease I
MKVFYLFALQWNRLTNNHTIHGLWPQFTEHRWPEYCSHTYFNKTSIEDLIPTLNIIWPSIHTRSQEELEECTDARFEECTDTLFEECTDTREEECNIYDNIDFWKHEWLRHGTCNYNHLDEHDYFAKVVDLYHEYGSLYKCHEHVPCFVKFDTNFEVME